MEWGPQVTGIHHRYQKWGFLDPFPALRGGAKRWEVGGWGMGDGGRWGGMRGEEVGVRVEVGG